MWTKLCKQLRNGKTKIRPEAIMGKDNKPNWIVKIAGVLIVPDPSIDERVCENMIAVHPPAFREVPDRI